MLSLSDLVDGGYNKEEILYSNRNLMKAYPLVPVAVVTCKILSSYINAIFRVIKYLIHFINSGSTTKPYGVIHFLGGAFVGAAPHITYRYLLETLCDQGYLIVATPYRLEMDYIRSCDQILSKFDAVAVDLAAGYYWLFHYIYHMGITTSIFHSLL